MSGFIKAKKEMVGNIGNNSYMRINVPDCI